MKLDAPEITIFANMQHTHASAAQGGPATAPETVAATGKTTPVDADQLPLVDSAASNVLKKLTWANAKATLKTYFDTLYTNNTGTVTNVSALTLGTTGTNLSSTVATGTTTPVITLQVPNASATNRGALIAADWTTFNNKQAALTPAALTKTDDTNIVLTLGGTPATALLQAASITVTWSGLLAVSRGGTGLSGFNANGVVYASSASALATSSTGLNFDSKNLGVGAIPTDGGACTNIELPFGATISARSNTTAPQLAMMSNAVGNWFAPTYKINGFATQYTMQGFDGGHVWYVAPSGVAGNAISFVNGMTLAQDRTVTMHKYGAGTATFSSAGVISSVSDETWKRKDGVPINPCQMLNGLQPGYWYYNEEKASTFGADRQLGFYAQNVNIAIGPEAAPVPEKGKPWGYYDRSVLAVTVLALQTALKRIEALESK